MVRTVRNITGLPADAKLEVRFRGPKQCDLVATWVDSAGKNQSEAYEDFQDEFGMEDIDGIIGFNMASTARPWVNDLLIQPVVVNKDYWMTVTYHLAYTKRKHELKLNLGPLVEYSPGYLVFNPIKYEPFQNLYVQGTRLGALCMDAKGRHQNSDLDLNYHLTVKADYARQEKYMLTGADGRSGLANSAKSVDLKRSKTDDSVMNIVVMLKDDQYPPDTELRMPFVKRLGVDHRGILYWKNDWQCWNDVHPCIKFPDTPKAVDKWRKAEGFE